MRAHELTETTRPNDRWKAHEVLTRSGYDLIGSGAFATIYEKPGKAYVLKLFDSDDDAYMAFIQMVRQHPNEHFPKLIGKSVRVSGEFFAIRMEKLTPYRGDPDLFKIYMMNRDRNFAPDSHTGMRMDDAAELFYEKPSLKAALDYIIDNLLPHYRLDLQPTNLMMRGSTIVFTDPVANTNTDNKDRRIIPVPDKPLNVPRTKLDKDKLQAILDDDLLNDLLG